MIRSKIPVRGRHQARRGRSILKRREKDRPPGCIDLFAGAGGLAEGFRQAGWKVLVAVDNDPHAVETLRLNFRGTTVLRKDVAGLKPRTLLKAAGLRPGDLDCLLGGPPCQSFSYNNHARSASGARARLFRSYLDIVAGLRPKTLLMENVPGMLTIGDGRIIREIVRKLRKLDYQVEIRILFAEEFGVPQERRRVFIVGTRLGWEDSLFPPGSHRPTRKPPKDDNAVQSRYLHRWEPPKGKRLPPPVTVAEAIGDLPPIKNGGAEVKEYGRAPRSEFQRRARGSSGRLYHHVGHKLSAIMLRRIKKVPEGGNWLDIPRKLLPAGMRRAQKKDHTKRYGRLSRTGTCCTILTKCDPHWGSYVHPIQHRTLTVREAARLQSFPDKFRFAAGFISKQYEQIGNAVPPLLGKTLARALRQHLLRKAATEQKKTRSTRLLALTRRPARARSHWRPRRSGRPIAA